MRFADKVAVVTGAAKGIGQACATQLAAEGAQVIVADVESDLGQSVAEQITKDGGAAVFVAVDVTDEVQLQHMIEFAIDTFGSLDVLVNNAGIIRFARVDDLARDDWQRVIDVNLTGCVFAAKLAIPHMRTRGGGAIVNIASVHTVLTAPTAGAYAASKGGLLAITRNLALELGPDNIRVNAVLPGTIRTEMFLSDADRSGDRQTFIESFESRIALRRIGDAREIAKAVAFCASGDASYMTGTGLVIDGGLTVQL